MNKFKTLLFLAVFGGIGLWGCDDSSSASSNGPDENAAVDSSSSICKDCDDESSSSDKKIESSAEKDVESSDDAETGKSSSSKGKGTSSSSVKTSDSSSSSKDKSSSSVNSSSSNKQSSSSVKSSSSSVKQSSSSVASSSSFVRWGDLPPNFSYGEFEYEQRIYKYLTVTGSDTNNKTATIDVMAENLNVGIMIDGSENQSDNSKVERYCYNNDTTKCLNYGGLYQWAEMMGFNDSCNTKSCAHLIQDNHQGICPDGWRLLTYNDFNIVMKAENNDAGWKGVNATAFGGLNYTGYSLVGAGYNWRHTFTGLKEGTYWFYPEESKTYTKEAAYCGYAIKGDGGTRIEQYKTEGFSVRCARN